MMTEEENDFGFVKEQLNIISLKSGEKVPLSEEDLRHVYGIFEEKVSSYLSRLKSSLPAEDYHQLMVKVLETLKG